MTNHDQADLTPKAAAALLQPNAAIATLRDKVEDLETTIRLAGQSRQQYEEVLGRAIARGVQAQRELDEVRAVLRTLEGTP